MRKRVSYMVSHHVQPMPEPNYSVEGPIVALTNELAGSDGDIFSHSFKWLKLGKLVAIARVSSTVTDFLATKPITKKLIAIR